MPPRGQDRSDPVRVRAADAGGQGQEEKLMPSESESGHRISVYILTIHNFFHPAESVEPAI